MSRLAGQRKGVWEPLPFIVYGYAVHPLSPYVRENRLSRATRLSTVTEGSSDSQVVHRDVVSLEVGDEVYAFERYTPRGKEVEGPWYRGYVVCTNRRAPIEWFNDPSASTYKPPAKNEDTQQVFLGIFPASHIFVRDEVSDAEGRLHNVVSSLQSSPAVERARMQGSIDGVLEGGADDESGRKSFRLGRPEHASSSRAGFAVHAPSVRSSSPTDDHAMKPLPPRPSLKSGDDTAAGAEQPIIDEIASVLREWHMLMFQYLARRDYKLFHIVREHIDALHLGRRQLLAQTLSEDETVSLRRECVARLVSCNVVQGLDVVVRHPDWGGLITVDVEGEIDPRSWVSAVRMYTMQVTLAYMEQAALDSKLTSASEYSGFGPLPTPAHSAFPEFPRARGRAHSFASLPPIMEKDKAPAVKFYHVYFEIRAFVASLCAPGETVELFFSLYNKVETKFVSEEFCAVLNHHGVLARDPSTRIRTLFTDLVQSDVQDAIYLVCRIVRNGSLKLGTNMSTSGPLEMDRRPSSSSFRGEAATAAIKWAADVRNSNGNITPVSPNTPTFDGGFQGTFRRPFGCAVLELTQLSKMAADNSDVSSTREHTMPIYTFTNEATFSMLHQDIIANASKEFEKSPRAEMLAVSIKVFHGQAATIIRENPSMLQGAAITQRLGFPDVVFPGDNRNDLYIKLWSGKFVTTQQTPSRLSVVNNLRGNTPQQNVQITMEVRDSDGKVVEQVLSLGSGEPNVTQAHSMVFQRNSEPTYGELIKLTLPPQGIPNWHLFLTFRYRNARDRSAGKAGADNSEKAFAFGFLPLLPQNGAFLEDGIHTLVLYRADRLGSMTSDMYLTSTPSLGAGQKLEQVFISQDMTRLGAFPTKDELTVRSSLCSTKLTQNTVLLSLLNWERSPDREFLQTILTKFTFVGEVEIVKFLRDIFDSLFGILVSQNNQSGEMDLLVFNALVTVLGIVQDRRFSNFQPVLDVYIENHFTCAGASSHIIHSMNRLLANPTSSETASALRAALKVWRYIFKFIAQSRDLQKTKELGMGSGATAEHLELSFKREVQQHLNEVNRMMSTPSPPSIIGTQTIALQHFTSILPDLAKIFSTVQLVSIATSFATSVAASKGRIVIWKLIMYLQLVKGFLFDNPQARQLLVAAVVIWIKPHFGRFDEYQHVLHNDTESARDAARIQWLECTRLCVTIIAVMLDKLQQSLVTPAIASDRGSLRQEQDNVEYLLSLMPRLLDSYREFQNPATVKAFERTRLPATIVSAVPVTFPQSYPFNLLSHLPNANKATLAGVMPQNQTALFNCGLAESAITFLVLVLSSPKKDILNFLENSLEIEGKDNFAALISQFFKVAISILDNDAFPSSWLNVNVLAHQVLIRMADPVATLLERDFIPDQSSVQEFRPQLWKEAVYMLLRLLSSEHLAIEELNPEKRRAVWRLAGDVRGEGAAILLRLWEALGWPEDVSADAGAVTRYGNYQVALNTLVGQVVNLCLSHHDGVRNNAVQILYSMIVSEYSENKHFIDIENELVNKLDSLFMSDSKADDISRAFFIGQLRHLFDSSSVDQGLRDRVSEFLDSVDLFLDLLLNVRALPEGEEYADDRVIATLRLMNFLRRIGRDEIYIKYVHQLVNMHLQSQNYVEAALTLKLHSDLHDWELTSFVDPMEELGLPYQSQFHRKETLCLLILDYLGKGKAWENAIEICKELAYQHAEVTFNYARLAEILRHQAALLEHIVTDQRYYSDYFRVAFYGNFPVALRNKQFIYRGYEWEKFGAFCERMLNKHPGASLLKSDPSVDIRFGSDQYIQCTAVTPEPNRDQAIFTSPAVPIAVRAYYEHSAINEFSASRQIAKPTPDNDEEVWVERTIFTTEEAFPTVLRRSEVVDVQVVEISPLDNAVAEVENKTKELDTLHARFASLARTTQNLSTNALSMALNTAVDAPMNGGIAFYRQVFLTSEYLNRFPGRADLVEKLRDVIDEHVRVIAACLRLHGRLCPQEMIPFHDTLEGFFRKNFHDEIQRLPSDSISETLEREDLPTPQSQHQNQQGYLHSNYSPRRSSSTHATAKAPTHNRTLQLGPLSPPLSPAFTTNQIAPESEVTKQTPLQRHLAHLARHGMTGVSSGPGDNTSDTSSVRGSLVNVSGPSGAVVGSGASITTSILGSVGSVRGRWSRLGSISFGRRDL